MKKLSVLLCATSVLLGFSSFAQAYSTSEPLKLKLADNQVEGYPTIVGDRALADLVKKYTEGRIEITVYPGGVLGEEGAILEQIAMGAVDMQRTSISPLNEYNKQIGVLMLPYIYRDVDHMFNVLNSPLGDKYLNLFKDEGFVGLAWYDSGSRNFYNSKHEIKSPADLKGLKIRVQETKMMMNLVTDVGGNPTPLPYGEVYTALQNGTIDGAENNWPSYVSTAHYEVAKYITLDGHTRVPEMIIISNIAFGKMTPEDQALVRKAAKESSLVERKAWTDYEQKSIEKAKEKKNIITILTPEQKKAFQDAVMPMYKEYSAYQADIDAIINFK